MTKVPALAPPPYNSAAELVAAFEAGVAVAGWWAVSAPVLTDAEITALLCSDPDSWAAARAIEAEVTRRVALRCAEIYASVLHADDAAEAIHAEFLKDNT